MEASDAGLSIILTPPGPYNLGIVESGGGTIAADTRSYAVIAVYAADNSDTDTFVILLGAYGQPNKSNNDGFANGANATLTFTWTAPDGGVSPPHHYLLAYQALASWNLGYTATIFASVNGSTTSFVATTLASTGTLPHWNDHPNVQILTAQVIPSNRDMSVRGFNGIMGANSFEFVQRYTTGGGVMKVSPFDTVAFVFPRAAIFGLNLVREFSTPDYFPGLSALRKWADKGWLVQIASSFPSTRDYSQYIFYIGTIGISSLADSQRDDNQMITITMTVEAVY